MMNRNLLLAMATIVLLIAIGAALVFLQYQTENDLDDAYESATQNAADYALTLNDAHAVATRSAQEAAGIQAGLEGDLAQQATRQAEFEITVTWAGRYGRATQAALNANVNDQAATLEVQGTQQAELVATATWNARFGRATQAAINGMIEDQAAQQAELAATATWNARYGRATQAALTGIIKDQATAVMVQATRQQEAFGATATYDANLAIATRNALTQNMATQEAALLATANAQDITINQQADQINTLQAPGAAVPNQPPTVQDQPLAPVAVGDLIFHETFGDDSLWPTGTIPGSGRLELREDTYWVIVTDTPAMIEALALPVVTDAYLEAEVLLGDCPADAYFAFSARTAEVNDEVLGYYFAVTCDLRFWIIDAYMGQGEFVNIAFDQLPPLQHTPDQRHVMGLWLQGNELRFYIDGMELGRGTAAAFASGYVGVYAETVEQPLTVRVDQVRVWRLP